MPTIEERVQALELRNKRVEAGKAWETSATRKVAIFLLTYLFIAIFLIIIDAPRPWLSAAVPGLGFFLSTLTLNRLKSRWLNREQNIDHQL